MMKATRIFVKINFYALIVLGLVSCTDSQKKAVDQIDVLVVGGGASGIAAGIQSARLGAQTVVVEETPWLGGMLTAAGVSATDGNHRLPSGLWGEFREKLYQHYGSPAALETGWVSNTQFEPHIGNKIWNELADKESNLKRIHGYFFTKVLKEGNRVTGAVFQNDKGEELEILARVTIDGTELGDVIGDAGAGFFQGQDPQSLTGEAAAPLERTPYIQDLTYVAILKDYGVGANKTIAKPANYDPSEFECMCAAVCSDSTKNPLPCDKMLTYGKLPNGKYMINWPNEGNDYYVNAIDMTQSGTSGGLSKSQRIYIGVGLFLAN